MPTIGIRTANCYRLIANINAPVDSIKALRSDAHKANAEIDIFTAPAVAIPQTARPYDIMKDVIGIYIRHRDNDDSETHPKTLTSKTNEISRLLAQLRKLAHTR